MSFEVCDLRSEWQDKRINVSSLCSSYEVVGFLRAEGFSKGVDVEECHPG